MLSNLGNLSNLITESYQIHEGAMSKILGGAAVGAAALGMHSLGNDLDNVSDMGGSTGFHQGMNAIGNATNNAMLGAAGGAATGFGLHSILNRNQNQPNKKPVRNNQYNQYRR